MRFLALQYPRWMHFSGISLAVTAQRAHMTEIGTRLSRVPIAIRQRWLPACESDDLVAAEQLEFCPMTFRPLHDRVLRRIEAPAMSTGGMILIMKESDMGIIG